MSDETQGCLLLTLAAVIVIFFCTFSSIFVPMISTTEVTGSIEKTYIKNDGSDDKYMAVLKDASGTEEVFQNTDSFYHWKFDSADFNRDLERIESEGQTCTFTVYSYRWPFISWFRNIVSVDNCH